MTTVSKVVATEAKDLFLREFEREWQLDNISSMLYPGYETPVFSPVPWIDARFSFVILYQEIEYKTLDYSYLNVSLKKLSSGPISSVIKFEYLVDVKYSDGTLYENYKSPSNLTLADWSSGECFRKFSSLEELENYYNFYPDIDFKTNTPHGDKMENDTLILKCFIKISGPIHLSVRHHEKMSSQNNLSKFAESFSLLFSSGAFSDVVIRAGMKSIPAHKCVLATYSPVFKKDFLESKTDTVNISDFEPEIIEGFLKFLYFADIEDKSFPSVKQLYILADKYDVQILKQECVRIIIQSFSTVDYLCEVLKFSLEFNDDDLKKATKIYAAQHIQEIITKVEWKELVSSYPMLCYEILASNYLPHDFSYSEKETEETDLFQTTNYSNEEDEESDLSHDSSYSEDDDDENT